MSYQALYRKWRPGEFEEVKGQEHIVTTLRNQIKAERIGHAYLFCGTRGTGKTTVAKLFAKTVNCEHPVEGSPCNECASCRAIQAGTSMNVMEIDAASNNGVENIREIRENVQYSPTKGKYKVYIIDEVHMLSIGAFNALLKTLEEPPSYVIFILATTEAHKIPITILSRCQRYDFKRISIDTIAARLQDLMQREQIEVEEKAIRYVAKAADGSMRDALSLLDQCIAFYLGEKLTYEHVLEVLGAVDMEVLSTLYQTIVKNDVAAMLSHMEKLVMEGREMRQLVNDVTWYFRNIMLVKESEDLQEVLEVSQEQLATLKEDAALCDSDTLLRYIRICSELSNQLRYSTQKRIDVEIAFVKLCRPQMERDYESLLGRVKQLEDQLEELKEKGITVAASQQMVPADTSATASMPEQDPLAVLKQKLEPAQYEDITAIMQKMKQVKSMFRERATVIAAKPLDNCNVNVNEKGDGLRFVFKTSVERDTMAGINNEYIPVLQSVLCAVCEKDVPFETIVAPQGKEQDPEYVDIAKLVTMPIETV